MKTVPTMTAPTGGHALPADGGPVADDRATVLDTVRIQHPDCPKGMLINASEFDPKVHKRYGKAAAAEEGADDSMIGTGDGTGADAPRAPKAKKGGKGK